MHHRALISLLLVTFTAGLASGGSQDDSEEQIIANALVEYYFNGIRNADPELLDQIFHEDWMMFYVRNGQLVKVDKSTMLSYFDPSEAQPDLWEFEVYYVNVTGTAAAANVRIENDRVRFIDYFNLLKLDGRWWIVHKIFHGEPK